MTKFIIPDMSGTSSKIFMTLKSSKIAPLTSDAHNRSYKVPVKTSLYDGANYSWLIIVMTLIAIAGILGVVGIALVSFVFLPSTTLSSYVTLLCLFRLDHLPLSIYYF